MIRIASNCITNVDLRDTWMNMSSPEYDLLDYHILYSQLLDSQAIEAAFICKLDDSRSFHRVLKCSSLLEVISVKILDDNLRPLWFPRHTICRLGLSISPHRNTEFCDY